MNLDLRLFRHKYYSAYLDILTSLIATALLVFQSPLFILLTPLFLAALYSFRSYESSTYRSIGKLIQGVILSNVLVYLVLIGLAYLFSVPIPWPQLLGALLLTLVLPILFHSGLYRSVLFGPGKMDIQIYPDLHTALLPIVEKIEERTGEKVQFTLDPSLVPQPGYLLPSKLKAESKESSLEVDFTKLCETTLRMVHPEMIERFPDLYLPHFQPRAYDQLGRVLNLILTIFLSIFFLPFMLIVGILIFIEDGSPVYIRQERIGKDCQPFQLVKFRSMREAGYNKDNPNANIEDRILTIGHFIRKTRLDETLQFINVFRGDMNIIGPRPELGVYHQKFAEEIPHYEKRLNVRPGITGWAQVAFKHTTSLEDYVEKTAFDLFYVKNRGFLFDVKILLKTIETIIGTRGSR